MKFGRRLLEELMEPGWEIYYIQYHALKKLIFAMNNAQQQQRFQEVEVIYKQFFARLEANLAAAEAFASGILADVSACKEKILAGVKDLRHPNVESSAIDHDQVLEVYVYWAERVASVLKFCITNRTAIRKITKKLDKNIVCLHTASWQPARPPFDCLQKDLTALVHASKETEYNLMTVSSQLSARVRSIRAHRFAEMERLKLRRVEDFERELVRPFLVDRRAMREVYFESQPAILLGKLLVGLVFTGAVLKSNSLQLPSSINTSILQITALLVWMSTTFLYIVHCVVVQAKLGPLLLGWRRFGMMSATYVLLDIYLRMQGQLWSVFLSMSFADTFTLTIDDLFTLLAVVVLCFVELGVNVCYCLGPRWTIGIRILSTTLSVSAFIAGVVEERLALAALWISGVALLLLIASFAESVAKLRLDVQFRNAVKIEL